MDEPTFRDVAYGDHERDVVDLYQVDSKDPAPVYVYIHGGGFRGGDKASISQVLLEGCHEAGISVAAINYPLSGTDRYPAAMEHSQRAIQFIRWKAEEWNLDASRVAAGGGSAGAGISMWIGFRGEEAKPESEDPVARQSTRLTCVASWQGQCSYDPHFIRTIISGPAYAHEALQLFFGFSPGEFDKPEARAMFKAASAINYVSKDAPPVMLWYTTPNLPMDPEPDAGQGIHHPIFGLVLKEKMDALDVECVVRMREDVLEEDQGAIQARFYRETVEFLKRQFGLG